MAAGGAAALLLGVSAGLLALAFALARAGRPGHAAMALAALGLTLRGFAAGDLQLHAWDERYHAVVARNLASHPFTPTLYDDPVLPYDAHSWLANHVWLHKPPLALWMIAGSLRVFGVHELAVRAPSLCLAAASILLTYLLGAWLFDPRTGLLAAYFHAVNGFLIDLASGRTATDHVDTAFIVLIEAAIVLAVVHASRGRRPAALVAAGLLMGLAMLTKWLGALLVVPVWLVLAAGRLPRRALVVAGIVLVVTGFVLPVAWQVYVHQQFPLESAHEGRYALRHIFEPLEEHAGSAWYYVAGMPRTFGELVYVPVAWFLASAARRRSEPHARAIALWGAVPYLVFSFMATKMPAYVMTAAPALFLMEAVFWWRLRAALAGSRWRAPGLVLLGLLVLLPLRYGIERVKPMMGFAVEPRWTAELRSLVARAGPGRSVLFNTTHPIEAMFYTPWPAYPFAPSVEQVRDLSARGYRVLVLDDGELPGDLRREASATLLPVDAAAR